MPIPRKRRELGQKLDTGRHGRTTRGGSAVRNRSTHGGTRSKSPNSNASTVGIIVVVGALCTIGLFAATRSSITDSNTKNPNSAATSGGTNPQPVNITFQNDRITLNGAEISLPTPLSTFTDILGEPDRVISLSNTIHTWDRLGIMCYARPADGQVIQITLAYAPSSPAFWPHGNYQGFAYINGRPAGAGVPPVRIFLISHAFETTSHSLAFTRYTLNAETQSPDGPMTSLTIVKNADVDR